MYNTFLVVRAQLNLNLEMHKKIYLTKFCFLFFFWTKETMATQQGGNPPTTLLPPAIAPPCFKFFKFHSKQNQSCNLKKSPLKQSLAHTFNLI